MPDSLSSRSQPLPDGWSQAFAALPPETPVADGWSRVARALDARPSRAPHRDRRGNWLIGLASAAVLAVVIWSPLARRIQPAPAPSPTVATKADGTLGPAAPVVARDRDAGEGASRQMASTQARSAQSASIQATSIQATSIQAASIQAASTAASATDAIATKANGPAAQARRDGADTPRRDLAARPRLEKTARPSENPQPAPSNKAVATSPVRDPAAAKAMASTQPSTQPGPLPQLQAQSARLEALVALARDDSAGSASTAVITGQLEAGVAAIDAALSDPGLTTDQRTVLWQQRVDALQQLAGVETTKRWLAAQGALYDTALVSVD